MFFIFATKNNQLTIMKTIKTRFFIVLCGMLLPLLTANCSNKKNVDKAETAETTAVEESVIKLALPPFQKFVVVTTPEEGLYKNADLNSPTLIRWDEADCESDFCEVAYQWSDQPEKAGFELSTDILTSEGRVFPVLGEEGNFYKVCILNRWCDIESAYLPKACVQDIETAPIKADMLESEDNYFKCRVMKDGKYKDVVLIDEYNELEGESLQVGVLKDGVVVTPFAYFIDSYIINDQNESVVINDSEDGLSLSFNKSVAMPAEDGPNSYRLDLKKLSDDQIAKIVDTVIKRKPEYVNYMYHFPAQGLETFVYMVK